MKLPRLPLPQINLRFILGLLVVLAPLGYLLGRSQSELLSSLSLAALLGLAVGVYFGALTSATTPHSGMQLDTLKMQRELLGELAAELSENKALFEARKGSTTLVARLAYVTSFWEAAKASGRLFVMQDAHLLSEIALAYYWLTQANHLETLAYDAKNSGATQDAQFTTAKLISEVRLLDDSIEKALDAALNAISAAQNKR